MKKLLLSIGLGLTLASSASLFAADNTSNIANDLSWVARVNKNEIMVSKVALNQATNADVKKLAQMMVDQHSQNLKDDMQLSKKLNAKLTDTPAVKDLQKAAGAEVTQLKSLKGQAFDKAYVDAMVKGHRNVLNQLDTLIANAQNPELQQFLTATRETVKQHLKMAEETQKKLA